MNHGFGGYVHGHCRCQICVEGNREAQRRHREKHPDVNAERCAVQRARRKKSKRDVEPVLYGTERIIYSFDGKDVEKFDSVQQAADAVGRDQSGISNALSGMQDTCGGRVWFSEYQYRAWDRAGRPAPLTFTGRKIFT